MKSKEKSNHGIARKESQLETNLVRTVPDYYLLGKLNHIIKITVLLSKNKKPVKILIICLAHGMMMLPKTLKIPRD